ncbi:hypothetical protein HYT02_00070 [Candidatus Gottesmanbacteria bacterium]|nr:hypothetical protein [Candidatus Gottesmanbacteria bacterium]
MNKRVAIILVTIFLLLSIAITVYIVVTQRIELRKRAQVPAYNTSYSDRTITDNCNWQNGSNPDPIVSLTAINTIYDEQTGVQKLIIDIIRGTGASASGDIEVFLAEVGCAGPVGEPNPNENQCNSCSNDDPVYFNNAEASYILPSGQNTKRIEIAITKPATQLTCGCSQIDVHIQRVVYEGNISQPSGEIIAACSTLGSAVNNKPRQYLYAVGWANNCTIAQVPTSTSTPIPSGTATPTPSPVPATSTPRPTATSTPAPNPAPVCEALSVSPNSGTAPLTVEYIGTGSDNTAVVKFEFTYGDGQAQTIEKDVAMEGSVEVSHTYTKSGTFTSILRVQDQNGIWSDPSNECSKTITINGSGATVTPTPTGTAVGGPNPTVTKTPTPSPTKTVSSSATPVQPDVPVAGTTLPTMLVAIGGLTVILLGFLLAL